MNYCKIIRNGLFVIIGGDRMKKVHAVLLLFIFISCVDDNPVNSCEGFITLKTREEIISDIGYKYCNVYLTEYINGVLDENSKYLFKKEFFNDRGYNDSTIVYNESGSVRMVSADIYDEYNNFIGWLDYYADGTYKENILFEYIYNEKGLVIRWNEFNLNSGIIVEYTIYTYNADGRVSEVEIYNSSNTLVNRYEYFYKGCTKPKEIKVYDTSGLISTAKLSYDKFGNVLRTTIILPNGNEETIEVPHKYDEKGRLVESHYPQNIRETYSYNSDNLIINWIMYDANDQDIPNSIYEYEYKK